MTNSEQKAHALYSYFRAISLASSTNPRAVDGKTMQEACTEEQTASHREL